MKHLVYVCDSLAPAAEEWLVQTRRARVLHIFDRSLNLINDNKDVISITYAGVAKTPLALTLAKDQDVQLPATWHQVLNDRSLATLGKKRDTLVLGQVKIIWDNAARWNAVPDWALVRAGMMSWSEGVDQILRLLANEAPPGSLAPLFPNSKRVSGLWHVNIRPSGISDRLIEHVSPHARELVSSLAILDLAAARKAAGALAGLGTGLTPSGDDFLMGTMHALWILLPEQTAWQMCNQLLDTASPKTSALSSAWLKAASKGQAGEHWHGLADAITGCDEPELIRFTRRILRTGHTSGADALTGFLMTIDGWHDHVRSEPA